MMRPSAEGLHFMETVVDEKIFGLMLDHHALGRGTHTTIAAGPVNYHKLAAWPQNSLHFFKKSETIFNLEEGIGKQNGIQRSIAQMRTAGFLYIAPYRFNNTLVVFMRIKFQMLKNVLLHINSVDSAAVADDSRCRSSIVAAAGAEVANLHTFAKTKLENVLSWRTEVRSHTI